MKMTIAVLALVMLGPTVGAQAASAQVQPLQLHFTIPEFVLRVGPLQAAESQAQPTARARPAAVLECPMPVSIPDLRLVERMPIARADTSGLAIPVAPVGCFNPLGPQARSARRTARQRRP